MLMQQMALRYFLVSGLNCNFKSPERSRGVCHSEKINLKVSTALDQTTKMKVTKIIFFLITVPLFLLSFSNCGGTQTNNPKMAFEQNPPFKITEAYYQNWVAGVKEGGSGTNVHIVLSEMDSDVVIQNIYFRNQILEAKGNVNEPNQFTGYLKNDAQRDLIMDADPMKEAQNNPPSSFPFQLEKNQAVVEYWFGGKKNYYKISNLTEKQMIPYPQANPNSHE